MTRLVAQPCGCFEDYFAGQKRPVKCSCGNRLLSDAQLNVRYAYVRDETFPHRRSRLLRSRLSSSAFEFVGEMGTDQGVWPLWFSEDVDFKASTPTREEQ